jgi:hypothetical protein
MSTDVQEVVSRFWASYSPSEDELSAGELSQIAEDARQSLELDPPSACVKWWSALPVAVQHKWLADPKTPTMYEAWCERRKRQAAADFARASVGLEGFKISEEVEQKTARFIAGEIDLAEFVNPAR